MTWKSYKNIYFCKYTRPWIWMIIQQQQPGLMHNVCTETNRLGGRAREVTYTRLSSYCSFCSCTVRRLSSISSPSFLHSPVTFGGLLWLPVQVHSSAKFTGCSSSTLSVWRSPACRIEGCQSSDRREQCQHVWTNERPSRPRRRVKLWQNRVTNLM